MSIQIGTPPLAYYGDILIRANPKLHEEAVEILRNHIPSDSKIVDLGCGQGAFSARLRDMGYDVLAVDKDPKDFKAQGIDYKEVNFDQPTEVARFCSEASERFDVAIGMEVIEHVENPWEYCRLLLSLVKPGGLVLLTTPNAESAQSRIEFLLDGRFTHFSRSDFEGSGHINPLTFLELELIAEGLTAEIVQLSSVCRLPWFTISRRPSMLIRSLLALPLLLLGGERQKGDIICVLLRKPLR